MGNVISNAGRNGAGINLSLISDHEELHIWQSRIFGPLFQVTYIVWAVGGFIVANIGLVDRHEPGLGEPRRDGRRLMTTPSNTGPTTTIPNGRREDPTRR